MAEEPTGRRRTQRPSRSRLAAWAEGDVPLPARVGPVRRRARARAPGERRPAGGGAAGGRPRTRPSTAPWRWTARTARQWWRSRWAGGAAAVGFSAGHAGWPWRWPPTRCPGRPGLESCATHRDAGRTIRAPACASCGSTPTPAPTWWPCPGAGISREAAGAWPCSTRLSTTPTARSAICCPLAAGGCSAAITESVSPREYKLRNPCCGSGAARKLLARALAALGTLEAGTGHRGAGGNAARPAVRG